MKAGRARDRLPPRRGFYPDSSATPPQEQELSPPLLAFTRKPNNARQPAHALTALVMGPRCSPASRLRSLRSALRGLDRLMFPVRDEVGQ